MNGQPGLLCYFIHVTVAGCSTAVRQQEESTGRYDTLPACLWSSLTFLPISERTSEMWLDPTNSLTCSPQDGAGPGFVMLLNNLAVAALGFRGFCPADSLSGCPQGCASNHINFERSRDSSSLTAVKSA